MYWYHRHTTQSPQVAEIQPAADSLCDFVRAILYVAIKLKQGIFVQSGAPEALKHTKGRFLLTHSGKQNSLRFARKVFELASRHTSCGSDSGKRQEYTG